MFVGPGRVLRSQINISGREYVRPQLLIDLYSLLMSLYTDIISTGYQPVLLPKFVLLSLK